VSFGTGLDGVQSKSLGRCQIPHLKGYDVQCTADPYFKLCVIPASYRFAKGGGKSGIPYRAGTVHHGTVLLLYSKVLKDVDFIVPVFYFKEFPKDYVILHLPQSNPGWIGWILVWLG
jgi:hypothetical protein